MGPSMIGDKNVLGSTEIQHRTWPILLMLIIMVAVGNLLCPKKNGDTRFSPDSSIIQSELKLTAVQVMIG